MQLSLLKLITPAAEWTTKDHKALQLQSGALTQIFIFLSDWQNRFYHYSLLCPLFLYIKKLEKDYLNNVVVLIKSGRCCLVSYLQWYPWGCKYFPIKYFFKLNINLSFDLFWIILFKRTSLKNPFKEFANVFFESVSNRQTVSSIRTESEVPCKSFWGFIWIFNITGTSDGGSFMFYCVHKTKII